ncbi:MAG TPA: NlpC/P60 family protein [Mycobacteriales bacterium]|nr:NlpC/P60 family protein [Mycobacteriales bacterium]
MSRRTLLLVLGAPIAVPLVLLLLAAILVSAIAGGSVGNADVPPGGVAGGMLKGGVPVPARILSLIGPAVQAAGNPNLTESVLAAQLFQESGFDPRVVSPVGAQGIAQFMPGTWAAHGRDENGDGRADPFDPQDAVPAAARYDTAIAAQVAGVPGDRTALMLAAYNAGPAAVLAYQGVPPYQETQAYVRRILDLASEWALTPGLVGGGEGPVPPPEPGQIELTGNRIIDTAMSWAVGQVGSWYQWGGACTDPFGSDAMGRCDCSSLVQQAYAHAGVSLPRVAADQATVGQEVRPPDVQPGDLIAIEGSLGSPTRAGHIGMYVGRGMVVEAPYTGAQVRLSPARSLTGIVSIRRIVTG